MRYYRIEITSADGSTLLPSSLKGLSLTSLAPNGQVNPGALNVEFDIPVAPMHAPSGQAFLRIWGLGLQDIGNAYNLNGAFISIYGGMSKGLPLANPGQARLLVRGQVFQAFGNWLGTEQTIDLILAPAVGSSDAPLNFVLNWTAGTTLAAALSNTFATAIPAAKLNININSRLVQNHDEVGYYASLPQLAAVLQPLSRSIITDQGYPGVTISYDGATITASDLSSPAAVVTAINFQDLVGQPTWIGPQMIQAKTVMRGDLDLLGEVTLPAGLVTNSQAALIRFQDKTTFSGKYTILGIHHYGNFRQADAASWNTTLDLTPSPKGQ